jgi:DNA-directed RNA polymerase subunit RPC12/RpoP
MSQPSPKRQKVSDLAETTSQSDKNVQPLQVIDDLGDVTFTVGNPAHEDKKIGDFRVNSNVLRLASPVFKRMLEPGFKEADMFKRGESIPLVGDDYVAVDILFKIVHYNPHIIDDIEDPSILATVALHSDKYDCSDIVKPWVGHWILARTDHQAKDMNHMFFFVFTAMTLNMPDVFEHVTVSVANNFDLGVIPTVTMGGHIWPAMDSDTFVIPRVVSVGMCEMAKWKLTKFKELMRDCVHSLRQSSDMYWMKGFLCGRCGREKTSTPRSANPCSRCGDKNMVPRRCTMDSRVNTFLRFLESAQVTGLWPYCMVDSLNKRVPSVYPWSDSIGTRSA